VQLSTVDEKAYHEMLVHVPLLNIEKPKRALVIGGGDGGVVRELTRNQYLEHIDMVEIDETVVALSRQHLPELQQGALDDPRVCLHFTDAFPFVKQDLAPYDIIVMDSTDTYEDEEGELSAMLFTQAFYDDILRLLSPKGFVITQADNLLFCPYSLDEISREYRRVFPIVGSYWAVIPSFGGFSGYCWASKDATIALTMPSHSLAFTYLSPATYSLSQSSLPYNLPK
ncbi:MAG: hypothetical protein MUC92_12400, partial [Fimbriimonadaceae bacterium]|nr:hypothetical protein [Fimbriimonadaceae bacterium]